MGQEFHEPEIIEREIIERLQSSEEDVRYRALVVVKRAGEDLSAELTRWVRQLEADPSRPVRQLSREILAELERRADGGVDDDIPQPLEVKGERYPGSVLLALIAWGSALTGVLMTGMSLLNYFMLGHFPYPNALDVLLSVNLVLTLPHLVIGILLLAPGKVQKRLALAHAYFSLVLCVVLIVGLGPAFDRWWVYQFTEADQTLFRNFLSPVQLAMVFLPVIAGQTLLIYFLAQILPQGDRERFGNEVDTQGEGR